MAKENSARPRASTYAAFILLLFGMSTSPLDLAAQGETVDLGSRLELFVDSTLVSQLDGVEIRLHSPVLMPASESPPSAGHYATVIEDDGRYRMYNRGGGPAAYDGDPVEQTEYFESSDGIRWSGPTVILKDSPPFSHNFSPFIDTRPGIPANERFKALAGTEASGLHAFVSSDGVSWRKMRDTPVFTDGLFDSQNVSFWSEAEGLYVCYFRTWTGEGYTGLRTISRTTSPDFVNWAERVDMHPNLPGEHLYTSGTHPYFRAPHIYVALPTRFQPERGNATDILFMTSRGGDRFDRLFKEAFIRPGPYVDHWANRANYAALNVVPTSDREMSIYVRGRRYALRTDGFTSIHAGFEEGRLTTKRLRFSGGRLLVNAATSAGGHLVLELRDEKGEALSGFEAAAFDTLTADGIALEASWNGSTDVGSLAGRTVILHAAMREADLYSIRFSP